ncbi:MAG: hypothetical protein IT370_37335 [Deltaproteobacteria bacterium]|nr:hypothetical protein [Deltaproteobacteria bacterium]
MRTTLTLSAVLALLGLAGCNGDGDPRGGDPGQDDAGASASPDASTTPTPDAAVALPDASTATVNVAGKRTHTLNLGGPPREFIVYVPALAVGRTAPVVFMFHGTSGDGEKFFNISGWREKADAEGLIAVFPSALTYCLHEDENGDGDFDDPGEDKLTTKWAHGELGTPTMPLCTPAELAMLTPANRALADHPLQDDIAFVRAMLDVLAREHVTDARRIYASGFSNGAGLTSRLVVEMADRFAAIHAGSGTLQVTPTPALRAIPVTVSVGELDDRFLTALGLTALPLTSTLMTDVPAIKLRAVNPMLTTLGLADSARYDERTIAGEKVIRFSYDQRASGGTASNLLNFIVIEDLYHQYPNGINHPLVAADLLWDFFRQYSLP